MIDKTEAMAKAAGMSVEDYKIKLEADEAGLSVEEFLVRENREAMTAAKEENDRRDLEKDIKAMGNEGIKDLN